MSKICTKCGVSKPKSEFYKHCRMKDGLTSWCKICCGAYYVANKEKFQKWNKEYHQRNKKKRQIYDKKRRKDGPGYALHLKNRYPGMTIERYEEMLETQGGVCLLCGRPELSKRLSVDHNHKTGEIRGLLCGFCNRLVGWVENYPILVQEIFNYLKLGAKNVRPK